MDVAGFYERAASAGYGYGPAFRGLTAAWRRGEELFAEVSLPEEHRKDTARFGMHPALLDAALHVVLAAESESEGLRLPFLWEDVSLFAVGATTARVHITPTGAESVGVRIADESGALIAAAESLTLRSVTPEQLALSSGAGAERESLYRLEWTSAPVEDSVPEIGWSVLGDAGLPEGGGSRYADLPTLIAGLDEGGAAPGLAMVGLSDLSDGDDVAGASEQATADAMALLQQWLAEERLADSRLVVVTRGAVATIGGELPGLVYAPVWGLVRSAQTENPGRFLLLDLDPAAEAVAAEDLARALACGESQVAVRGGRVLVPRLVRADSGEGLLPPAGESAWRLDTSGSGSLEGLSLVPAPEAWAPLAEGEVRIEVRAAGVNFRDVLMSLGMYPGEPLLGSEAAGVVLEVGPGVSGLVVGDRV
ncbi:polyketide synthase dehydratase domain-containing protein, partial [Streptomyces chumphonensis]|uniref:polyketide synthase dehydratase domain-containing protein n=1 Tax=Streptomyces chumphonensis TaxID=1214925 RepID=UPI003D745A3D